MYKVILTQKFLNDYNKVVGKDKILKLKVKKAIQLLSKNPLYPSLKSHKVNTRTVGMAWSSRVNGDIRIIWDYNDSQSLIIELLTIGGHTGKYKVYN
jgi:mRNA-degrading endonuclease YafQ of YafQ-DinJ toxin-antitoxin module